MRSSSCGIWCDMRACSSASSAAFLPAHRWRHQFTQYMSQHPYSAISRSSVDTTSDTPSTSKKYTSIWGNWSSINYRIADIFKREGSTFIDVALGVRYNGSGPFAGDVILPVLSGATVMLTERQCPLRYVPNRHFYWRTGLVNGAIVKFYGFPEHARTRDNIIAAP